MSKEQSSGITNLQHQFGFVIEVQDPLAGKGVEASVERGAGDVLTIQLFPDTGIATVETRLMHLALRGAHIELDEANDSLELKAKCDGEWTLAAISRNGSVLVTSLADKSGEETIVRRPPLRERANPSTPATEKSDTSSEPEAPSEEEKNPRVTLSGRVGTEPRFRTTKSNTLVGTFPLAVHDAAGKTTWHTIVAFKDRAEKLKGVAIKGTEVEVVGYVHTSERKDKNGETTERNEVWASVVKTPKAKE